MGERERSEKRTAREGRRGEESLKESPSQEPGTGSLPHPFGAQTGGSSRRPGGRPRLSLEGKGGAPASRGGSDPGFSRPSSSPPGRHRPAASCSAQVTRATSPWAVMAPHASLLLTPAQSHKDRVGARS